MKRMITVLSLFVVIILTGCHTSNNNSEELIYYEFFGSNDFAFVENMTSPSELKELKMRISLIEKNLEEITIDIADVNQAREQVFNYVYNGFDGEILTKYTFQVQYTITNSKFEFTIHKSVTEMKVTVYSKTRVERTFSSVDAVETETYTLGLYEDTNPWFDSKNYVLRFSTSEDNLIHKFGQYTI